MRHIALLRDAKSGYSAIVALWQQIRPHLEGGLRMEIEVRPERRSSSQNARLWAMLTDISRQVEWYGQRLDQTEWKHVFTAAMKRQKVVPGLDGGFVVLGQSTSNMSKAEMSEMQELMEAFGAERGVRFTAEEHAAA